MAHVWNITDGNIYVSKNGNDTTGNGSMANPYASINKATTVGANGNKIVIGTGVWKEARGTSTNKYHFQGDGEVIVYIGLSYFRLIQEEKLSNLILTSDTKRAYLLNLSSASSMYFTDCIFNNAYIIGYNTSYLYFKNCLFINCSTYSRYTEYSLKYFTNCTLVNHELWNLNESEYYYDYRSYYTACILKNSQKMIFSSGYGIHVEYCCFADGGFYNDNFNTFIPISTAETNGWTHKTIGLDPFFNNQQIGDYTLQPTSPCLFAGKNNGTIGAFGLGYSFNPNSSVFIKEGGATFSSSSGTDDIVRASQTINGIAIYMFNLAAGKTTGNVESAWIDLQTIRYLLTTRLFANLIYNVSGVATSRPDNYETAGEKAVYYDFEFKYCLTEAEKATAAWKAVIWNKAVTIDNSNRGNADAAFVASEAKYISARFVKIKLYMKES